MKKSIGNLPDSTKVPDDMLALQRKRIAALRPETDKLLARIAKVSAPEAMLLVVKEGLVKMTETCKILSLAIHDVRGHQAPFTACQDEFCLIAKKQIDDGAALVVTASELKPKETDHG